MPNEIHRRIKMARVGAGMSQADLASAMSDILGSKVTRALIHNTENGSRSPRLTELEAIANATDQTVAWLIGGAI